MTSDAPIQVLYDGACPVCAREVNFWRRRDRHHRLRWVDISADDFDAARFGLSRADVQSKMHAILPDGRVVTAVDAFRHVYRALGMGWLLAPTDWPVFRPLFDRFYRFFATRIRPRISRPRTRPGQCATGQCDAGTCGPEGSCNIHRR